MRLSAPVSHSSVNCHLVRFNGSDLRELYGALAPVAVVSAAGGDVLICPGRDVQVAAGDEVTLVGTPDGLRAAGMGRYADDAACWLNAPWPGRLPVAGVAKLTDALLKEGLLRAR